MTGRVSAGRRWRRLLRALRARGAQSGIVLVVALVAVATAATGPAFVTAADAAILADTLHDAPALGHGVGVVWQGPLSGTLGLADVVDRTRAGSPGGRLLPTLVRGQERTWTSPAGRPSLLAWRDGLCDHLHLTSGRCATARGEVVVSASAAQTDGTGVGDRLSAQFRGAAPLTVVGLYEPVDPSGAYWFAHGYFPQQGASVITPTDRDLGDAVLTVPATFAALPPDATGLTDVDLLLDAGAVTGERTGDLRRTVRDLQDAADATQGSASTTLPDALDAAASSAARLRVPVVLITLQLLVPVWLLLFLAIGDAASARAGDLAVASLRGHGRLRTLAFGLGEPVVLLAVALVAGLLGGWALTVLLAGVVLRPGTPVVLPPAAVLAGVGALSAGLLAAALAGVRTVRRPVLDQWRRTRTTAGRRGWVVDVAVLVATAAATVQLLASGAVRSAAVDPLSLLVPGLLGLGAAVATSRALPWACRRAFGPTARAGGLGPFLAVRQVARRPAGLRTVLLLTTSFALATFAVAAWTVTGANADAVGRTRLGAATVLDVVPAPGEDLGATVARLDPDGRSALAVDALYDPANAERLTLAVDPDRFARIAFWRADFGDAPLPDLARRLRPPAPDPVSLSGDRIRVTVAVDPADPADPAGSRPVAVEAGLQLPAGHAVTPLALGGAPPGRVTVLEAALPGSPAVLRTLRLDLPGASEAQGEVPASGPAAVRSIEVRSGGIWHPVAAALTGGGLWRATTGRGAPDATGAPTTLRTWTATSWPDPLPALVTADVGALPRTGASTVGVTGLDGAPLAVRPVATVTVPGTVSGGLVVDRTYARRIAYDTRAASTAQVWLAEGVPASFADRLRAAGVRVAGVQRAADTAAALRRQGPALAASLFAADAVIAALLAALGTVAALHLASRRRRYELSVLAASGCPRSSLRAGLWLEQALVLGPGVVAGTAAGLLAVRLALPAVPEFVEVPAQPALLYVPAWGPLALLLGLAVAVTAAVAAVSVGTLLAGVRPDQLREAPA